MEVPQKTFGERLRALRDDRGWNQQTLARKSRTSQPNISRLETGVQMPEWETVQRIAQALGVSPAVSSGVRVGFGGASCTGLARWRYVQKPADSEHVGRDVVQDS